MKILSANLPHSSVTIYQLNEKSSDEFHDHGSFYQISIPILGDPYMEFHGETKKLGHRAVTMIGEEHRNFTNHAPIRLMLISLDQQLLKGVLADQTGIELPNMIEFNKWGNNSSEQLKRLGKKAIKLITDGSMSDGDIHEIEWEMAALLLNIQPGSHSKLLERSPKVLGNPALQNILSFIEKHHPDKLSNKDISTTFQISQMQLYRMFQDHLGVTPNQYVKDIRLQTARDLLIKSKKDITTISYDAGFGSLSSFERVFKKKFGVTPTEFRKKL
ncbi:helix-turn-helix transcriptional regulator [Cytobacillus sp. FJAT-54145]|uniref:Helix-turn-helix transcriptional regulator n=1 Tax=Cytobacillus spartinae TaxID=3299023 RepID=A0ABW6KAX0_9BACI